MDWVPLWLFWFSDHQIPDRSWYIVLPAPKTASFCSSQSAMVKVLSSSSSYFMLYALEISHSDCQSMCTTLYLKRFRVAMRKVRATHLHQGKVVCLLNEKNVETGHMWALKTKFPSRNNLEQKRTLGSFAPTSLFYKYCNANGYNSGACSGFLLAENAHSLDIVAQNYWDEV